MSGSISQISRKWLWVFGLLAALAGLSLQHSAFPLYSRVDYHAKEGIGMKSLRRSWSEHSKAAVSSEHPRCSQIGVEILLAGGNAVDAAISASLCVGIINSFSSGIGGGGFMLVRKPDNESHVFDFRETAPHSASPEMFVGSPSEAKEGGRSVAIPGEIQGFADAYRKYGRIPWRRLFEPNIQLAIEGFEMTPKLASMVHKFQDKLVQSEGMRNAYFRADSRTPKGVGEMVQRPNLARTLTLIAEGGADVFYRGEIASSLVAEIKRHGGDVELSDFSRYTVRDDAPIISSFRGYEIVTVGPPASGAAAIRALNIFSALLDQSSDLFRFEASGCVNWDRLTSSKKALFLHYLVESLKFAYAGRMKLGDPGFVDLAAVLRRLLDNGEAVRLSHKVSSLRTFDPPYYMDETGQVEDRGTMHVSVLDEAGMAVSCTSTVNHEFGAKLMDAHTGIVLNNEMDDFSIPGHANEYQLPPSSSNFPQPGKRPQSSSTPIIVLKDGKVVLITGGTGGSRIIASTVQVLVSILVQGLHPSLAVSSPRFHHQLVPNELVVEHEYAEDLARFMEQRGHDVRRLERGLYFSGIQLISVTEEQGSGKGRRIVAVADPRKGGGTAGY